MRKFLCASIGNCVHITGIANYCRLLEQEGGWQIIFLGPALDIPSLIASVIIEKPDVVGISYRLTPANVIPLLAQLQEAITHNHLEKIIWEFGGTRPVVEQAANYPFLSYFFDGSEDIDEVLRHIRGKDDSNQEQSYPRTVGERIKAKYPYPILRHHFGLPDLEATITGVQQIAESKVLDVISLGPDQNAQQFFFRQEQMDHRLDGAGGVPLRSEQDLSRLYQASRCGNFPLMRCYSGTSDVLRMAELLLRTINNAWAAIPICWYNVLDGRGERLPLQSITEAKELIAWHAARGIAVEVNEPHHWALRDAPDVIFVAMAYISAYIAKKQGVGEYIAQYMFNTPNTQTHAMDLAKMLAARELIASLEDDRFIVYRQVRAGLTSLNSDLDVAKGQLAASTYTSLYLKPHIIHVVGFCEAEHAATPEEVIESCKIVRGVLRSILHDAPNPMADTRILERKQELLTQANYLLDFLQQQFADYDDPLANPAVLAMAIKNGIIDAPHLRGNCHAAGCISTRVIDGKCDCYSPTAARVIDECERLKVTLIQ